MQPLDKTLRNKLEKTIKEAREAAEAAARAALEQLGVGEAAPFAHLSEPDRELRRKLRVHGRQLGDSLNGGKIQTMDRLIEEVAYEHWHRMLFARFLAENNLLMYIEEVSTKNTKNTKNKEKDFASFVPFVDENAVAVTLEECSDLAADEGLKNEWEMAAKLASRMLPQIFRPDSPVFQLSLPPEHQQKLERLVADLELPVFTASDSLGWVYQFWQAKKKDEVNASEVKIGARELPAVTQLFTEPYMVSFLLDNSLGAWFVAQQTKRVVSGQLSDFSKRAIEKLKHAESEAELREFFSLPGVPFSYLRFVKTDHCTLITDNSSVFDGEHWMPAAGWFDGWPDSLSELKTLDPCCGSGHFLVAAFLMLVPMRMERDGLSAREAADAVLRENIHGLELDQRCVELAAFALALTAWKYPDAGGYRPLPELNIACSGLSVSVAKEEWKQLGSRLGGGKKNLTIALGWMHDTFKDAPVLGSLLNPAKADAAKLVQWDELSSALEQALQAESTKNTKSTNENEKENFESFVDEKREVAVVAQGLAKAATLLAGRYQWVMTNVPYLARGKQNERLRDFCEKHYPAAKNDLATVFLDRCLELCAKGGTSSIVLPQNWLFLTSYKKFREKLLKNDTWHLIARLGPGAFETISGEVVKAILITLSRGNSTKEAGGLFGSTKNTKSTNNELDLFESFVPFVDNKIRGLDVSEPRTAAEKAAQLLTGEIKSVEQAKQLDNPDARVGFQEGDDNVQLLINYVDSYEGIGTGDLARFQMFWWESVLTSDYIVPFRTTSEFTKEYAGYTGALLWESGAGDMVKKAREQNSRPTRGFRAWGKKGIAINRMRNLESSLFYGQKFDCNIAAIIPKTIEQLPAIWAFCSSPEYPVLVRDIDQALKVTNHTLAKVPFDLVHWTKVAEEKYPNGLPRPYTDDPTQWIFHGHPCGSVIWNEEQKWTAHGLLRTDDSVLHVAVARLLGYRWPAELDPNMELADEQREWVKRCEALASFADDDGIVCIPPVRGEASASDRLLGLLAAAHKQVVSYQLSDGSKNTDHCTLNPDISFSAWTNQILAAADHGGKSLETWLREKFFTQHCKLFQHRPFIWHIWDGLRDGFAALVNYHKLDAKLLETLIYTYLGDWISRQKQDIASGVDGAQERLAAAEALKKKLELILEGEAPYDIFVRWKPLEQQPIGWDPDLNDGVRLNIRPFLSVPDVGKKGAGCLRDKPNIHWNKDRGKDVKSAPWYHLFNGDRINDHHLSLDEKKKARGQA
ncbi:Eco57I restriction-modification methylase domain-containing protein [Desulfobulbus alkaliphilus]|uniref:Eco57I restriction-modification methylase domain-containing protein n=1 Tax=Desulfobulbus alkaliphilus TaxID=869814 RepID=UPI0019665304|nr:N-6 DNA methylase [Desulfobulbus alkaliphilus]MBM9537892.1 N-6 DNA methylase [Desulfobulbus alkaliphilus]